MTAIANWNVRATMDIAAMAASPKGPATWFKEIIATLARACRLKEGSPPLKISL
jgi:hypothetical protein